MEIEFNPELINEEKKVNYDTTLWTEKYKPNSLQ
jgi:hypothetical protein